MAAFFENPLFLFVDETEPILPIFRSPEYNDSGRKIVELTDVGCDTETTFPIHFLRGKFNRRRGVADSFRSARKIAKQRNERPTSFSSRTVTILDDFQDKKARYTKNKLWRNDRSDGYGHTYSTGPNCNAYAEDSYDDWEFSKNDSAVGYNNYYTESVSLRNMTGHSRKERPSPNMSKYPRNFEISPSPSPSRGNRVSRERARYQRENTCPLWFDEDERRSYKAHNIDVRSRRLPLSEHRKRMRVSPGTGNCLNRGVECTKDRVGQELREQEDVSFSYVDPVGFSKNDIWDFTLENEPIYEESICSDSTTANNQYLWEMTSQNLDSQQAHVNVTDSENSEFMKTREKNNSANSLSSKDATNSEKPKAFRSNLPDTNTPRVRSAGVSTDQRLSNVHSTGKGKSQTSQTSKRHFKDI
ncbi:hypothetical protein EAI_14482 [Harpegnathos saltator]|uniref:Uncharacterized protein n=1 Tax=Harpegnathos saltator TaxID=610380 RepID=E2C3W5_HARSA|nr:hypothetical protein EAI_14482 [Harpegnathos saltator]